MSITHLELPQVLGMRTKRFTVCLRARGNLHVSDNPLEATCTECLRIHAQAMKYDGHPLFIYFHDPCSRTKLNTPEKVHGFLKRQSRAPREIFTVLYLDSQLQLLESVPVSTGTASECLVTPSMVFPPALELGAHSYILVHNHPSGALKPSEHDWLVTEKMKVAGDILNIPLQDHVVISSIGFYSLREDDSRRWKNL